VLCELSELAAPREVRRDFRGADSLARDYGRPRRARGTNLAAETPYLLFSFSPFFPPLSLSLSLSLSSREPRERRNEGE